MAYRIQLRRGTAANWTSVNTVLAQGEAGYETDTGRLKIGDGLTAWNSLAYFTTDATNIPTVLSDLANDVGFITLADLPAPPVVPTNVGAFTNDSGYITTADLPAPTNYLNFSSDIIPDGNATRSLGSPTNQWKELFVSTGSIYIGNVKLSNTNGTLQINTIEKQIDPETEEEIEVVLETESVQFTRTTNLELTNTPLIVQPAILGTPVTVTAAPTGYNAQFTVVIGTGPTIDSIVITAPGNGYTAGQIYRIWSFNIGGPDDASSIDFTVDTVDTNGEILTISNAAFVGIASNTLATYTNVGAEYRPYVFDAIDTGLTLTRGLNQGIYNSASEQQYDNNTYLSPLGTEWNSEGWGNLLGLGKRTYTTWRQALNNRVGNEIVASELVMHDIANDKYYRFDFTNWGGSNGGYSYTRTEVTDPNYFRKPNNAELGDIIVADDPVGSGVAIVRTDSTGIWNLFQEAGFSNATSPVGTTWNADGWDDLSNLTERVYTSFDTAAGGYNNVLGKKFVMYVASVEKYYAIEFLEWATDGTNSFAYTRHEIDQNKIEEGIRFADGTILKSAAGVGRVKSVASSDRRIEEVVGNNTVSVTQRLTTDYTGISSRTTSTNYEIFVERTPALDAVLTPIQTGVVNAQVEISFDGITYQPSFLSSIQNTPAEYWFYYNNVAGYVPQTQGNTVYIRITSGADPVVWWNAADLPGGDQDFRGAVIDYHAFSGEATWIGTIHIVRDSGENHISHTEVSSGSTDSENDDLWVVTQEGQIKYRRIDGEAKTLKVHWTAKVFYGSEFWD